MEPPPAGREDDEQGDEHQDKDVERLDGDLLGGEELVSLDVGVDRADPVRVALGKEAARGNQDMADPGKVEPNAAPDHLSRPHGLDAAEAIALTRFLDQAGLDRLVVLKRQAGVEIGEQLLVIQVDAVGDTLCVLDNLDERRPEPEFDVTADQVAGEKEQEEGGDDAQGDEEQDQPGFEMRADDIPFALEIELDQVSPQDEKEHEK